MAATINSAAPTSAHRADFFSAFQPATELTATTTLTWPAAAGTRYHVNSASAVVLTLPNGAIPVGSIISGVNLGAGALSFAAGGGETIVGNAILPTTVSQYDPFELQRISGNRWLRVA